MSSLNDLAAANLAFSAAGIGISVAGFALIDFRLKQIERSFDEMSTRLDQILSSIERVQHDRVEHDLGEIRGLAELFEESWLLTDSGRAESNWRRVYQDGAGLQEIFSRRARIALDRDRDDYSSADPFLEAFALISGLRIASLLSCNEVSVARRIEEDSTHRLLQLTGSISLIDLVRNALPDDLEKGTRRWQLEQAKACEAMRPVVARIRTREQLLATRTAVLPSLEAKNVSPRDWFAQTRSEDAEAIVLLRD
ncbi:hypothetical protein GCM10011371_09820 [Novosphingobium marinum]|nr:hypothetical protein GCM10011371_09820 [Novosphingobium marinum]